MRIDSQEIGSILDRFQEPGFADHLPEWLNRSIPILPVMGINTMWRGAPVWVTLHYETDLALKETNVVQISKTNTYRLKRSSTHLVGTKM